MNKVIAIVLLVILVVVLILLLRPMISGITKSFMHLPVWMCVLLVVAVIIGIGALALYLFPMDGTRGIIGGVGEESSSTTPVEEAAMEDNISFVNCIVLRDDQIWIDNTQVDMEYVEKYIDEHVESNTRITIIDDYALASLHHQITDMCDKKGVKYDKRDEK